MTTDDILLQKVEYYRQVRPPTLKQFLIRKSVREAAEEVRGITGTEVEEGRLRPSSALAYRDLLKGVTAEDIAVSHPEWVEEWKELYG